MKAADRYRHLVGEAARTGTMWALSVGDEYSWVTYADPRGYIAVPLWPTRDDATRMATGIWRDAVPVVVPVDRFLATEVGAMQAEGVKIAAFPTPTSSGAAVRAEYFGRAVRDAMAQ